MTERREAGYGPSPAVHWRGWLDPLVWTGVTLVALTVLTAYLIENPFGFWTYLVSLGAVALVWLLMVVFVVGKPPEGDQSQERE